MWRDKSSTAIQSPLGSYQQYSANVTSNNNNNNSNGKPTMWNQSNNNNNNNKSSSYSLPHPGHAQSNFRWQNRDDFIGSSRTLLHSPSYPHLINQPNQMLHLQQQQQQQLGRRPVSMYDTPSNTNAFNFASFKPNNKNNIPPPNVRGGGGGAGIVGNGGGGVGGGGQMSMRQMPGELVRYFYSVLLFEIYGVPLASFEL